ncbi:unnamed protein product [Adineta steineri]|uniref:Uncharacterized protein n=1 Tax=Adineta steineri TaxID=433720 RepID=A0A819K797_9BILA|nr:unnamed protein product [Adineta steineri]
MFARLACTRTSKVTVWYQRDQNVPTKIKINSDSDIDDLKEAIFGATNKGQYQATYKAKILKPSASVPWNTTDDMPIVFTKIGNIPPLPDSSRSNRPIIRTVARPMNPITTNQTTIPKNPTTTNYPTISTAIIRENLITTNHPAISTAIITKNSTTTNHPTISTAIIRENLITTNHPAISTAIITKNSTTTNQPTISTATIPKNPITTNKISTQSQINQNYQRYENRSKSCNNHLLSSQDISRSTGFSPKEESQANPIRSAMIQPKINRQVNQKSQILKVDNTDPNAGINQKIAEESKREQAVIRDANEERIRRQQSKMGQIARINNGGTDGALRWQVY